MVYLKEAIFSCKIVTNNLGLFYKFGQYFSLHLQYNISGVVRHIAINEGKQFVKQ